MAAVRCDIRGYRAQSPMSDIEGRQRRRRALGARMAAANGDDTGVPP